MGSESSLVSKPSNPSLVCIVVVLMQYSADTPLLLRGDVYFYLVFSHPVQPTVVPMQYSIDTPLLLRGDAFFDLVFSNHVQPVVVSM
jgi:hypothetical protein